MNLLKAYKIGRRLALSAIVALAVAACSDELDSPGADSPESPSGELVGPCVLEIGFDLGDAGHRSRSDFDNTEIRDVWVGMFDNTSNKIIASQVFEQTDLNTVTLSNIYYNDDNPDVIIVGAANVKGRKVSRYVIFDDNFENFNEMTGEFNLEDVLTDQNDNVAGIRSLRDYLNIVVDTQSCEDDPTHPLMSGVYTTGPGHYTFNSKGVVSHDQAANSVDYIWTLSKTVNDRFVVIDLKSKTLRETSGMVYLNRLFSKISVEIETAPGISIDTDKATFQVYNVPAGVYIQERNSITNPEAYSDRREWNKITSAASDVIDDGYYTSNEYGPGQSGTEYGFEVKDGEGLRVDGSTLKFSYWHYENKHWGLPTVNDFHKRETRYPNSDVFSSLCHDKSYDFNNNASYFVLRAHVKDANNNLEGDVEYLIHEGFCCLPRGQQATSAAEAAPDFSTFRNIDYTYNIRIAGLNNIVVKVTKDNEDPNPAVDGNVWNTAKAEIKQVSSDGETLSVAMPSGNAIWAIEINGATHGTPLSAIAADSPFYSVWENVVNPVDDSTDSFSELFDGIRINGMTLDQCSFSDKTVASLSIPAFDGSFTLYLCTSQTSDRSTYNTVAAFKVDNGVLLDPQLITPGSTANVITLGLNNHSVYWTPIQPLNPADNEVAYLIYVNQTGAATKTLKANTVDGKQYPVQPVVEGNYLRYTALYTTMNGFAGKDIDITVEAYEVPKGTDLTTDNIKNLSVLSSMAVITRTIKACPATWAFNSSAWASVVSQVAATSSTGVTDLDVTIDGLNVFSGGGTMRANAGSNFQPQGVGNMNKLVFRFTAGNKGTLTVKSSNTGSSSDPARLVTVQVGDNPANIMTNPGATNGTTQITSTFTINPTTDFDNPNQMIYIYPTGGALRIYSITFTPSN